jgi:hypothetical protein
VQLLLLLLGAAMDGVDVIAQRVGLDKLFGTGGTLVLELRVVLHLVARQLVQAGHHRAAVRARDVQQLKYKKASVADP